MVEMMSVREAALMDSAQKPSLSPLRTAEKVIDYTEKS